MKTDTRYTVALDADLGGFSVFHSWSPDTRWDWDVIGLVVGPYDTLGEALTYGENAVERMAGKATL